MGPDEPGHICADVDLPSQKGLGTQWGHVELCVGTCPSPLAVGSLSLATSGFRADPVVFSLPGDFSHVWTHSIFQPITLCSNHLLGYVPTGEMAAMAERHGCRVHGFKNLLFT